MFTLNLSVFDVGAQSFSFPLSLLSTHRPPAFQNTSMYTTWSALEAFRLDLDCSIFLYPSPDPYWLHWILSSLHCPPIHSFSSHDYSKVSLIPICDVYGTSCRRMNQTQHKIILIKWCCEIIQSNANCTSRTSARTCQSSLWIHGSFSVSPVRLGAFFDIFWSLRWCCTLDQCIEE